MDLLRDLALDYWKPAVELAVIFALVYVVLRFMQGTHGEGILRGLALVFLGAFSLLLVIAKRLQLPRLEFLLDGILETMAIALVIIFHPELRRGLMRISESPIVRLFFKSEANPLHEVVAAAERLSKNRVGALIAIERDVGLKTYIEGGTQINSDVKSLLIETIFWPGTPLHDGAIIVQNDRIAAAGCLFPLSENPDIAKTLGTRHRAAIGLSEESDAIVVIVSEETGGISVAHNGKIYRNLDKLQLEEMLVNLFVREEKALAAPAEPKEPPPAPERPHDKPGPHASPGEHPPPPSAREAESPVHEAGAARGG